MWRRETQTIIYRVVKTYPYTSLETAHQSKQKHAVGVSPLEILVANSCWRGRASPKSICLGASAAPEYGRTTQSWRTICQAPSALLKSCSRKKSSHRENKSDQHKTKDFLSKRLVPVGMPSIREKNKTKKPTPIIPKTGKIVKSWKSIEVFFFHLPISLGLADQHVWKTEVSGDKTCRREPQGLVREFNTCCWALMQQNKVLSYTVMERQFGARRKRPHHLNSRPQKSVCLLSSMTARREI